MSAPISGVLTMTTSFFRSSISLFFVLFIFLLLILGPLGLGLGFCSRGVTVPFLPPSLMALPGYGCPRSTGGKKAKRVRGVRESGGRRGRGVRGRMAEPGRTEGEREGGWSGGSGEALDGGGGGVRKEGTGGMRGAWGLRYRKERGEERESRK